MTAVFAASVEDMLTKPAFELLLSIPHTHYTVPLTNTILFMIYHDRLADQCMPMNGIFIALQMGCGVFMTEQTYVVNGETKKNMFMGNTPYYTGDSYRTITKFALRGEKPLRVLMIENGAEPLQLLE